MDDATIKFPLASNMSTFRCTEQLLLQKKRKLDQSLESGESSLDHGQALEKNIHHDVKKLVTTLSCVTNFRDIIGDSLDEQTVHNSCISSTGVSTSIQGYQEKQTNSYSAPSTVDHVSPPVVIDGSVPNGSNSWSRQQDMSSRDEAPEDPSGEADSSELLAADEESNMTVRRQVFSRLYLDNEYPPRTVVPIGPGFQAEVPEWVGTCAKDNYNTSESTKYSGTVLGPIEDGTNEILMGSIGRGRHELCSCKSRGSANCIKRHVSEARSKLELDLGPAFWNWKFDEMGGQVSGTSTKREKHQFETLMKRNQPANQERFWDKASKCIPTKSKDSIFSYYYNLFIPKQIRMQLRSSTEQIISDVDEPESEE